MDKECNQIVVVKGKTVEEFEDRILECAGKYNILKTDFGATENYLWIRLYCS